MSGTSKTPAVGFCRSCNREVPLEVVSKHFDGRGKIRCSLCNSTDVRPMAINAANGLVFGALRLFAGLMAARSSEDITK